MVSTPKRTTYLLISLMCQLLLFASVGSAQSLGDWFDAVDELELRVTKTINDLLSHRLERVRAGEGTMATFTYSAAALPREILAELAFSDNSELRAAASGYVEETFAVFQRSSSKADYATYQRVVAAYRMISAADDIYFAVMRDASSESFDLRVRIFELWAMNRQIWDMW